MKKGDSVLGQQGLSVGGGQGWGSGNRDRAGGGVG